MAPTTIEEQLATAPPLPALNVTEKTVCISITFGALGNSRKVSTSEVEVDTDKSMIRVNKTLLDAAELKAITKHDGELRSWLVDISLPSFFRAGFYLVPIAAIEKVQERLLEGQTKRAELVEAFLKVYKQRKSEAETRLKGLYNPTDYPAPSRVRAMFVFEWSWISFTTPGKLKEISASFFEQEQQKAATKWAQATEGNHAPTPRATQRDGGSHGGAAYPWRRRQGETLSLFIAGQPESVFREFQTPQCDG